MSLLNDALRNAEQRQKGSAPESSGVYTGGPAAPRRSARWPLVLLVLAVVLLLAGYGASRWFVAPVATPDIADGVANVSEVGESGSIERPQEARPEPEPAPSPAQIPAPVTQVEETVSAPAPVREAPQPVVAEAESVPQTVTEPPQEPVRQEPVVPPADPPDEEQEREASAPPQIKQSGQSPEARDREASRNIRNLLADGRRDDAFRQLASITGQQAAPLSRRVMVRDMLASGQPDAALQWLPDAVIAGDSELRLLRARALLAKGDAEGAVAILERRVPAIEDHAAYRVTLATLLQQQKRYSESANHWGALIAWDDSRAAWWAGLAITLEAQGNRQSAVRAYREAARLPGLSAALADYVRQRLQALQAG